MFIAVFEDPEKNLQSWIYYKEEAFIHDTFSPACNILAVLKFAIPGKNYKERKEAARLLAIEYQNINNDFSVCWSYSELATLNSYFEDIGRRYGLINEFKENCII